MQSKLGNGNVRGMALFGFCLALQSCGGGGSDVAAPAVLTPVANQLTTPAISANPSTTNQTSTTPANSTVPTNTSGSSASVTTPPIALNAASAALPTAALNTVVFGAGYPVSFVTCGIATTLQLYSPTSLFSAAWSDCTGGTTHQILVFPNALLRSIFSDKGGVFAYDSTLGTSTTSYEVDYVNRTITFKEAVFTLKNAVRTPTGTQTNAGTVTTVSGRLRF